MTGPHSSVRRARALCLTAFSLLVAGCEEAPPPIEVYPAHGIVLGVDGNPVAGVIEFRSKKDYRTRSISSVGDDGKFSLSTRWNDEKFDGAAPGDYEITFSPRGSGYIPSIELDEGVTIKPEENNLTIRLTQ